MAARIRDVVFYLMIVILVLIGYQTLRLSRIAKERRAALREANPLQRSRRTLVPRPMDGRSPSFGSGKSDQEVTRLPDEFQRPDSSTTAAPPTQAALHLSVDAHQRSVPEAESKNRNGLYSVQTRPPPHLNLSTPAVLVSPSCPLPVLHPHKFQQLMHWGERKSFHSCEALPDRHTISFSTLKDEDGTSGRIPGDGRRTRAAAAVVVVDASLCPEGGVVLPFADLEDHEVPRLESVLDAELRQNELRARFAEDPTFSFATRRLPFGGGGGGPAAAPNRVDGVWTIGGIVEPYVLVVCGSSLERPVGKELHVRSVVRSSRAERVEHKRRSARAMRAESGKDNRAPAATKRKLNVLHVMWDSTSIYAFRRSATRTAAWLESLESRHPESPSRVFTFKHYHSVSCCSPGNQIPMYSGNINGEGDNFVRAEPRRESQNWLWNVADSLGYVTFWSLDNCPDKSARDYHAAPSVDYRVVAPLCLAGVLLSHKELTCLAGKTVDRHVLTGLRDFWKQHPPEVPKFAAVQFITPHEETEKQLLELDIVEAGAFQELEASGVLNDTAVVLWSDHGINFGKYAATHDGELEKLLPFAHVILPSWLAEGDRAVGEHWQMWFHNLRRNQDRLISPYDLYELSRSLLYWPDPAPPFVKDPSNPPLPKPSESHIMASFQKELTPRNPIKEIVPMDRDCADANIPVEFCTCVPWVARPWSADVQHWLDAVVVPLHRGLVKNATTAHDHGGTGGTLCRDLQRVEYVSSESQVWPTDYKPKEQTAAKRVWMMPNRDMLKITYRNRDTDAVFEAVVSVDKKRPREVYDVARIDRLDAMRGKCGIVNKVAEQLCECLGV